MNHFVDVSSFFGLFWRPAHEKGLISVFQTYMNITPTQNLINIISLRMLYKPQYVVANELCLSLNLQHKINIENIMQKQNLKLVVHPQGSIFFRRVPSGSRPWKTRGPKPVSNSQGPFWFPTSKTRGPFKISSPAYNSQIHCKKILGYIKCNVYSPASFLDKSTPATKMISFC